MRQDKRKISIERKKEIARMGGLAKKKHKPRDFSELAKIKKQLLGIE